MDSFIDLAKSCPSLPTMLRLSWMMAWSVVEWWPHMGVGALRCSLSLIFLEVRLFYFMYSISRVYAFVQDIPYMLLLSFNKV